MNTCKEKKIPYIIFFASDFNTLKERLFKRGDTEQVLQNAEKINEVFKFCALYFSRNYKNVYALDISKESNQIEAFEKFIKEYGELINE